MDNGQKLYRIRTSEVTWRAVEDNIVIVDMKSGLYLTVNQTGSCLWPELVEGATTGQLVATLRARHPIDETRAQADTEAFLRLLHDHDLLA